MIVHRWESEGRYYIALLYYCRVGRRNFTTSRPQNRA
jgi:hypothetical protein